MKPSTKTGQINKKHLKAHKRKLKKSEAVKVLKTPTSSMISFSSMTATTSNNISITSDITSDMVESKNLLTMDNDCDKSNDGNPDFYNTGRVGRRNALPDILGQHCMTSTADLPDQLSALSTNDDKTGTSNGAGGGGGAGESGGPSTTNGKSINKSTTNQNPNTITTSQKNTS